MALNDRDPTLGGNLGVDAYPGVANPTSASMQPNPMAANFADDPTNPDIGAGAGSNFRGDEDAARTFRQTAGVVEGRPGIIESAGIDPLGPNSNKDDGWANATTQPGSTGAAADSTATSYTESAKGYASAAADTATAAYQAGKEAVFGKSE